jgi:D-alanine-D-alanine ligase
VASWFEALGLRWQWVPVTTGNIASVVGAYADAHAARDGVVLNLCDGNEIDDSPGLSVVRALEEAHVPFTGSASAFYELTTHKGPMKARLIERQVLTSPFVQLRRIPEDIDRIGVEVGYPAFIKPEVSAGSGGIGLASRVEHAEAALARVTHLLDTEDGGFYRHSGLFAEQFIDGREFTVFVVADRSTAAGARAYPPAERVFHSALPSHERFLSYDRYWSAYKEESRLPDTEPFYRYGQAPADVAGPLADLAVRAFHAVDGTGYGRVDIRMDSRSSELFVLEVNSNCGLSGDRETSLGELLHLAKTPVPVLLTDIFRDAFERHVAGIAGRPREPRS